MRTWPGPLAAACVLLMLPAADGWAQALSCRAPSPLLQPRGAARMSKRAMAVRWTAQLNPVEKFASDLRDAVAGVSFPSSSDEAYHEDRIRHHEQRIRHHEERMEYHRKQLSSKRSERVLGGSLEERLRLQAVATGRPMQILFVDLSNTCRSPAAEATMRKLIAQAGMEQDIIVRSCSTGAGTRDWFKEEVSEFFESQRVDPRMVSHAARRGLNELSSRKSTLLTKSELESADLLITMDSANAKEVQAAAGYWKVKNGKMPAVRMLTEYCRSGTVTTDIPDPYYGGKDGQPSGQVFEKVLDLLEDACKGLLRDCAPGKV
eukprot:Tamp_24525.p1 GENE.Tamp_24525~~Tamp_24525.p1  ORF type:complete len:319 (+),score=70.50 Tamp_24525:2-958(+)